MEIASARKILKAGALILIVLLLVVVPMRPQPNFSSAKTVVLHATVTITGGVSFTGSYDERLVAPSCADLAKSGTNPPKGPNRASFNVPIPAPPTGNSYGPVGGGHTFSTDVSAYPYTGPGTYTGSTLTATQLDADTPPDSQDTHIFAFPTGVGTMIVKPDASGSFQFDGLQDPGSVKISGSVIWTCS